MTNITEIVTEKIYSTIKSKTLLSCGDKIIVGLSGGADSMCLVHALCALSDRLGIEAAAAHMNHNIRGEAAEQDAKAAEQLCKTLGIRFFYKSEKVKEYARSHSVSEELAGRELRYRFFEELQSEYGFSRIATAHNKNDSAETLIMNFMRGSTVSGLCGIPVKRGNIIRPLIDIERNEIEEYCRENRLPYVTDSTNLEQVYTRNKIRLGLIPYIQKEFNSSFINTVTANARIISEENEYINSEAQKEFGRLNKGGGLDIAELNKLPAALKRRVVKLLLNESCGSLTDFSSKSVEDILELCAKNQTGKSINIPKGCIARTEYGKLTVKKPEKVPESFSYKIKSGDEVHISELDLYVKAEECNERKNDGGIYISVDDVSKLGVRCRRNGDIFFPVGMSGKKKLKDFFIDKKLPAEKRGRVPIITVGDDIASVADMRADRRYVFGKNRINLRIELYYGTKCCIK